VHCIDAIFEPGVSQFGAAKSASGFHSFSRRSFRRAQTRFRNRVGGSIGKSQGRHDMVGARPRWLGDVFWARRNALRPLL
jgi:hypothetical protein